MWPFSSSEKSVDPVSDSTRSTDGCPVDHSSRATWQQQTDAAHPMRDAPASSPSTSRPATSLPSDRVVSSIPRWRDETATADPAQSAAAAGSSKDGVSDQANWVYPSQRQFHAALERKGHTVHRAEDMKTIVPIHNAVNERTWNEVMDWERRATDGDETAAVKLVSFRGRPKDLSPRARFRTLLGYKAPFDRHDWIVDRNGQRIRYIIDFYTGKSSMLGGRGPDLAFFLDVRPALDNWEGVRMRISRSFDRLISRFSSSTPSPSTDKR